MILTIVRFPGSSTESVAAARAMFEGTAPRYLDIEGLLGKVYLRADDGSVGAVYLWTERAHAEARFNPGWFEGVTAKYGAEPTVEYLDAPLVVDNVTASLRTEPPPVFRGQGDV